MSGARNEVTETSIGVITVATPDGMKDYVALTSAATAFSAGLLPEAILGVLKRPLHDGGTITPDNFIPNSVCAKFLAHVIAKHGPQDPELQAEAARVGKGYVILVDQRTPTPQEPVPPEDILGAFEIKDGKVPATDSYRASPNYKLLTKDGFFKLNRTLMARWQEELAALAARPGASPGAAS